MNLDQVQLKVQSAWPYGPVAEQLVHGPTGRCTALRAGALLVHSDGACALSGPGARVDSDGAGDGGAI